MSGLHFTRSLIVALVALADLTIPAARARAGSLTFSVDLRTGVADAPSPPYITFKEVVSDGS